jgi:molecular chaperone GrpE
MAILRGLLGPIGRDGSEVSAPEDRIDPPEETTEPAATTAEQSDGADAAEGAAGDAVPEFADEEVLDDATPEEAAADEEPDPLEAAQAEASRLRDQLLRTAADFDNYRKRSRRDVEEAERRGREELLRELLPVFDNLERASVHAETASDVNSLADGIAMVRRQFLDTLGRIGIQRIEALGQPFDPAVHEAIQQIETDEFEPGTVANEFQAGYRMGERLVRPAMVVVAKKPPNGD